MPELRVRLVDVRECEVAEGETSDAQIDDGEAQLHIERFALSANNVTYADLGDRLGYWQLFPAPADWGRVPAWGYARVVRSRSPAASEGERVVGLVPMGRYVTVRPEGEGAGFADAAEHRAGLSPVYNSYLPVDEDAGDAALIMRPLFATSVLLDLVLAEAGYAPSVILTSASSKTAYGLAHLLGRRGVRRIGLTSDRNRSFVDDLGLYDEVHTYAQAPEIVVPSDVILVDFAGDPALLRAVHEHLGDRLVRSLLVGLTHRSGAFETGGLPGPAPEFFFAPAEMVNRGPQLAHAYVEGWGSFAPVVERTMRIEPITEPQALVEAFRLLVDGRADPAAGYAVTL
jgi:hypothetical protein